MSRVSVIIPVYNVEEYLAECLESVINQTEKDIEIICVEDCSTDSSLEILQDYEKKDDRIIILQNEKNSGLSVTRNNGLAIAQGDYVLFVDSDDLIEPTLLETTLKYAIDVDMVCFNYKEYNPQNIGNFSHNYLIEDGLYSNEDYFVESADKNSFVVVAWSKLYRREFLIKNNLQFEPDMLYEDNLFYLQCVLKAKKIYSISEPLYIYRIRQDSIMTKKLQPKNVNDQFKLMCKATEEYIRNDFSAKCCVAIEKFIEMLLSAYAGVYRRCFTETPSDSSRNCLDKTCYGKLQRIYAERLLGIDRTINFSTCETEIIKNAENVIVYGAGDIARKVISCLDLNDVAITGIAVSNTSNNRKSLMGNSVRSLSYYENIKDNCLVIVAVTSKFSNEIVENLKEQGFYNYIKLF